MGAMEDRARAHERHETARLAWAAYACVIVVLVGLLAPSAGSAATAPSRAAARRAVVGRMLNARAPRDPLARASIVGGTPIAIAQAPWQVAVFAFFGEEGILCSGSILSPTEILTAAHCAYGETTQVLPAKDFLVVAGTDDLAVIEPGEQERTVSVVRPHPYYNPDEALPAGDDVAVLTLTTPLTETAGSVQKIGLGPEGVYLGEGTTTELTGFGAQNGQPRELNGRLYAISMSTTFRRRCGGESDALYVCASTPSGALCNGDSGSALTSQATPATVEAVVDTGEVIEGVPCRDGAGGGFANVAAPEIHQFILGSESPPRAPRGGLGITIRGVPQAGNGLRCEAGSWSNSPSFTYSFINKANGSSLQSGPGQTYALTAADVGRAILCEVQATNPGGTGAVRTEALPAIAAAVSSPSISSESGSTTETTTQTTSPAPVVTLPQAEPPPAESSASAPSRVALKATTLSAEKNGTATVKLACVGTGACSGRVSLTVRHTVKVDGRRAVRTVSVIPVKSFSIAEGGHLELTIKLSALARTLLDAAHGHLAARLTLVRLQPAPGLQTVSSVELSRAKSS
jgi:hypothetical protein